MDREPKTVSNVVVDKFPFCCVHHSWSPPPLHYAAVQDRRLGNLLQDLAQNAKDPYYSVDLDELTVDQLAERVSVRAALASVFRRLLPLFRS